MTTTCKPTEHSKNEQQKMMSQGSPTYQYINPENIYGMADGEREFEEEIILYYLNNSQCYYKEFETAVQEGNYDSAIFQAHKIKGLFKIVGAEILVKIIKEVERACESKAAFPEIASIFEKISPISVLVDEELNLLLERI